MRDEIVDDVLRAAALVPSGRVATYGDLAELVGTGPRQVGWVMSHYGHEVAWWRVVGANGNVPPSLLAQARRHWLAEGIGIKPTRLGCRIREFRCDLSALGEAFDARGDT